MQFAIDNQSTVVSDDQVKTICLAMNRALPVFCGAWSFSVAKCVPCDMADATAVRVVIIDDDPAKADELGDHSEDGGVPVAVILAKVATDAGGGVLDGGSIGVSVASVICHEVYEALCDLNVNDWCFDGKNFLAKEVCDPVEGAPGFEVDLDDGTSVLLSNGVYPAYFDPQAQDGAALDMAGACKIPFELLSGGYQIVFDVETKQETQVFGAGRLALHEKLRAHRAARREKRHRALESARARRAA